MSAAAWFTHRLEAICTKMELSASVLSLLGALGANIPNYAASISAIASGQMLVGLGIIIGSNIYNIAIILAVSTFGTPGRHGIVIHSSEVRDVRSVGTYSLAVMLATLLELWLLPNTSLNRVLHVNIPLAATLLLYAAIFLVLGIFCGQAISLLKGVHRPHHVRIVERTRVDQLSLSAASADAVSQIASASSEMPSIDSAIKETDHSLTRLLMEALAGLAITLIGVVFMVRSGQTLTHDLRLPSVVAGLLVLAVATSLPNTVVAFSLARDNRATACLEEIFSSNSINATLGIALPLLFWHTALNDKLLLLLDAPLMVILTLIIFLWIQRRRVSRLYGVLLLFVYAAWVIAHIVT